MDVVLAWKPIKRLIREIDRNIHARVQQVSDALLIELRIDNDNSVSSTTPTH